MAPRSPFGGGVHRIGGAGGREQFRRSSVVRGCFGMRWRGLWGKARALGNRARCGIAALLPPSRARMVDDARWAKAPGRRFPSSHSVCGCTLLLLNKKHCFGGRKADRVDCGGITGAVDPVRGKERVGQAPYGDGARSPTLMRLRPPYCLWPDECHVVAGYRGHEFGSWFLIASCTLAWRPRCYEDGWGVPVAITV